MTLIHHFLIGLLLLGGGVAVWLAAVAWRRHPVRWALPFTVLCIALAYWALGAAAELSVADLADKLFWLNLQYLAIAPMPLILLWFALAYTNRTHWLRWYVVLPALVIPLSTIVLVWGNWGGAWREAVELNTAGVPFPDPVEGFWFPVQIGFAYVCIATMLGLLLYEAWQKEGLRRQQALVLVAAVFIPMLGNVLTITGLVGMDITPLMFALSAVVMAWGLARYGLFDVGLTARQLLINSMADGMIAINREGLVVDVNEAAVRLLQRPRPALLGYPLPTVLADHLTLAPTWPYLPEGEVQVQTAAGVAWYDVRLSLVGQTALALPTAETAQGILILLRDITQRKQEAQAIEELRQTLTRAMVHDLRSPIAASHSGVRFLQEELEEQLTAEDRRLLLGMESNLHNALKLINEILDLSQLESGHMTLVPRPFGLAEWVETVIQPFALTAESQRIALDWYIDPTLPPVVGDYDLLARVLQNLVGNGLKFTPVQGRMAIRATRQGAKALVVVSNEGEGVPEGIRPFLFQKFVKGTQAQAGSGLGLAFCKMVLEAHGEPIWLAEPDPELGGASFAFTLPLLAG